MSKKLGPLLLLIAGLVSWGWSILYGSDGFGIVLALRTYLSVTGIIMTAVACGLLMRNDS